MATTCLSPHTLASIRKGKVAFRSKNCRLHVGVSTGRCRGAFDRRLFMATVDFAVLAGKVVVLIWVAQLVWIGSRLLERWTKIILRSVSTLEKQTDRPNAIFL